jgi:hypothetical protein
MQDDRSSKTSSRSNRRRTALVLLLAVGTLVAVGAAGTALWGRGDAVRPAVSSPQSQATTGGGNSQSTGAEANSGQNPAHTGSPDAGKSPDPQQQPGNPGNPGKLPPVNQVPTQPLTPPAAALPKPTIPPGAGIKHP